MNRRPGSMISGAGEVSDSPSHPAVRIQRTCACGGHTSAMDGECGECKSEKRLQTKLVVGGNKDPQEREADQVADQVVGGRTNPGVGTGAIRVQRVTSSGPAGAGPAPASVDRVLAGPGRPLEPTLRQDMGVRFGQDFSRVRVHADREGQESARDVQADAYTVGNHVVFAADRFSPLSTTGRRLIAHELTHVVQQKAGSIGLQRQPAASSKPAPQADIAPGLGPARAEEIKLLLDAKDFQGAVDALVGFKFMDYEIDLNLLAGKRMLFDPSLTSADGSTSMPSWDYLSTPQKAQPPTVRMGPGAMSSVSYLYSVVMHEYQHVLWQQTLPHQNESHLLHSQGFETPDEVRASAWELLHANESGIARIPSKVSRIWSNLNESFWKLDKQAQASERPLVTRAFQKATTLVKGTGVALDPFAP